MRIAHVRRSDGFTLVELMAVVVLISLTLGVGLTLDFAGSPQQQEQQARQFANELRIAAQEAVLDGAVWGLDFYTEDDGQLGYRWLRLDEAAWTVVSLPGFASGDTVFAGAAQVAPGQGATVLVPEARVAWELLAEDARFAPEILLQPTREATPFTLRLGDADADRVVIAADLLGRVSINDESDADVAAR